MSESKFAKRLSQIVVLLFAWILPACIWSPADGGVVENRSDTVTFTGYYTGPSAAIRLEVKRSDGGWDRLASTVTSSTKTSDMFAWTRSATIANKYWKQRCTSCDYEAVVRGFGGDDEELKTFNVAAQNCAVKAVQGGKTVSQAGGQCQSGNVVRLSSPAIPLTVMSFNTRTDDDPSPNTWAERLPRAATMFRQFDGGRGPHVVGLQELDADLVPGFLTAIERSTGSDYSSIVTTLGDNQFKVIVYRTDRVSRLDYGHFKYANSRRDGRCDKNPWGGWDEEDPKNRGMNWARFEDKVTGKKFYFYNTHFPSKNSCEREGMAILTADDIASREHKDPVIFVGDFNDGIKPDGVKNGSYQMVEDNTGLRNAYTDIHGGGAGDFATGNGGFVNSVRRERMIDHILVSRSFDIHDADIDYTMITSTGAPVDCSIVVDNRCGRNGPLVRDVRAYSDHWAVWAELW